jgi:hypothetical protein
MANMGFPGLGSLMARRRVGYTQVTLTLIGFGLGLVAGLWFIVWSLVNWSRYHDPDTDPFVALHDLWQVVRWPLLGIGLFAVSWLWALVTSISLWRQAVADDASGRRAVPPRLADLPKKISENQ